MRALMNLAIEPALHLFEVSTLVVMGPSKTAVQRVLKVLANTPAGAMQIVRDRYPRSRAHRVLACHDLPGQLSWA
jgi:ABC-type arginine transport system ATPase subunit